MTGLTVCAEYSNPVLKESGDPDCLRVGQTYYLYLPAKKKYEAYTSPDLVNWKPAGAVFQSLGNKLWAPDVYAHSDGKFYLYFTELNPDAKDPAVGDKDIGVAVAGNPLGPFRKVKMLIENDFAAIDPNLFRDRNGLLYLYYKIREREGGPSRIMVQRMKSPTVPDRLKKPIVLLESDGLNSWERHCIEQPFVYRHENIYYLFYSGHLGDTPRYAIGYAASRSPLGPFRKSPDNPLLSSSQKQNIIAPGATSIVKDRKGQLWMIYRQKVDREKNWDLHVCIDRLDFKSKKPVITPTLGQSRPAPTHP